MIVSQSHGFIFVHVPKTGGTSVRRALAKCAGDLALKNTKHETLQELGARVGLDALTGLRPFGFVRNPWARFFSLHRYLQKSHPDNASPDFPHFVARAIDRDPALMKLHSMRNQTEFFDWDGEAPIIYRFERLASDFRSACGLFGVNSKLHHLNANPPSDYRQHYNDRAIEIVNTIFRSDINVYGYTFDRP